MALNVGQPFKRTSKGQRFDGDVMTKAQMLAGDDTQFEDGYLVVEKDSHDLYIYDSNATPSQETGKFVKSSGSGGYVLPTASASTLGGVKVGDNLNIDQDGVLSVDKNALPMTTDLLWELPSGSIVNPDTITLLNPTTDYDQILVVGYVHSNGKDHLMTSLLLPENLTTTNDIGLSDQEMRYIWYDVTSTTQLTKRIGNGGLLMFRIYGIRFGSSLNGTIGRWEKIGEWQEGGVPKDYTIANMSDYNAFSFEVLRRNGYGWYNTALILAEDFGIGEKVAITGTDDVEVWIERIDATTIRRSYQNGGTAVGIRMYGYKETAISDADVQKIADATALKSTNMEALWNNGELKGMKLVQDDNDLRIFDDGQVLLIDGNTTTRVNLTTKNYVDTEVAKKQDTLTAGTNITIDANNVISASGGGSLPSGGTTGQALVKKSDADQDVEWADQTVIVGSDWGVAKTGSGAVPAASGSNIYNSISVDISDLGVTSANDYQVVICPAFNQSSQTASVDVSVIGKSATSFTVKALATNANSTLTFAVPFLYTIFAKGYGSVPNGGTTGQALVKKSNTDGDVEWKTVSGGGASLTIDTTQVGYGEATISEGGQNLSFTNQNGQGVRIGGISENGEMVTSKSYVDSKSPTIVNEGATFTNAQGNQQMQIRTGGTNSVIIKDTSANGVSEYWSYELPDKTYVDTELAKKGNAITTFDNEYKTLQIRDVSDSVEFQVVKETSNDYVRMNEYAKDDRGQMQQIFDVKLPTKEYVDSKGGGVNMEVGAEKWYGTYTEDGVTYQVYSKIVYIPALPSTAGITTYPMGVSNIKQILNIYGYTTDGFILNAPRQNAQDNISIYQVSKGSQTFSIEVGKDRSSKKAYVTIIYAKNN